jgi:molecular chaperone GrpE (heat shock protein)
MSKKAYIIWAIFLIVPGVVGQWAIQSHTKTLSEQTQRWRSQVQDGTNQYLDSYQKWVALSPEQKMDNPWGKGIYGGPAIQNQLRQDQNRRLAVDIAELAQGEKNIPAELAFVLYGPDWQQKVEQYQQSTETQELIRIGSLVCLVAGLVVLTITVVVSIGGGIITRIRQKRATEENPATELEQPKIKLAKPLKPQNKSEPQTPAETEPEQPAETAPSDTPIVSSISESESTPKDDGSGYFESLRSARKTAGLSSKTPHHTSIPDTDTLVSTVESSSMMTTEPVLNSLSELTEEVSAIRQYAAKQQDQVKKLQDGYDWMLIRRFCMRIIRCIDNLHDRIRRAEQQNLDTQSLEEIRDELTIALESSGVEQFEPDLGVDYKGLERYAEAIGEKEPNDLLEKSGTIARVLRPGYQYLISDEEVKVVRCAQVKLFE